MVTSRDKARAHAKRQHFCTCGKIVRGNGAKAQHQAMHLRRDDSHRYVTEDYWRRNCLLPSDPRAKRDE
jgi:hypothetical protein